MRENWRLGNRAESVCPTVTGVTPEQQHPNGCHVPAALIDMTGTGQDMLAKDTGAQGLGGTKRRQNLPDCSLPGAVREPRFKD